MDVLNNQYKRVMSWMKEPSEPDIQSEEKKYIGAKATRKYIDNMSKSLNIKFDGPSSAKLVISNGIKKAIILITIKN